MRTIEFRAWDKIHKGWFEKGPTLSNLVTDDSWDMFNPDDYVWEQYTGLKDKNGKKIYEGDILQNKKYMSVVEFSGCAFLAKVYFGGKPTKQHFNLRGEIITSEVVGNIHQNVDLLEES